MKRNVNTDTPLPPEEPAGQNPPDGAIINYYLRGDSKTPVTLEIFDSMNQLVRRYSSDDKPARSESQRLRGAYLLVSSAASTCSKGRDAALRLGPQIRPAACLRAWLSDLRDLPRHAALSAWTICTARHLHREADGKRRVTFTNR